MVARAAAALATTAGVPVRAFVVENRLFGAHVTVTGLLGGAEVLDALRRDPLVGGEWLARAARLAARGVLGRTLDDVGEDAHGARRATGALLANGNRRRVC